MFQTLKQNVNVGFFYDNKDKSDWILYFLS